MLFEVTNDSTIPLLLVSFLRLNLAGFFDRVFHKSLFLKVGKFKLKLACQLFSDNCHFSTKFQESLSLDDWKMKIELMGIGYGSNDTHRSFT